MTGTFVSSTVLTAAALNTAINTFSVNTQTGTSYTLVLTDAGKLVTLSNGSPVGVTIPLNSSVAFAIGTTVSLLNLGAGLVTVSGTGGVTLNGTATITQNNGATLIKTGTDTWSIVSGGLPKAFVSGTTGSPTVDTTSRPGKTIYKFTGSGSMTISSAGLAEVLIVGGGGNGANYPGGGGGQVIEASLWLTAATHTITVGAAETRSSAFGIVAANGESGGYVDTGNAGRGGVSGTNYLGGTSHQESGNFAGGGGAGHSAIGASTAARVGGNGGAGATSTITGASVGYGGGGGGYAATGPAGTGQDGGGNGNVAATANTGGGGGGNSKAGATGVVIVVIG